MPFLYLLIYQAFITREHEIIVGLSNMGVGNMNGLYWYMIQVFYNSSMCKIFI
jgi:hypothetical protein